MAPHPKPLLVIVGETASGKSALALRLAKKFNGELICADSWTVYKEFDIGTAKPPAAEQRDVRHHLLDVADPSEGFSAVLFKRLANEAIADITSRGKLPILVGGTGLYIDSVVFDYGFLPATDPALRAELDAMPLPEVLARAEQLGLNTMGIDLRNKRRVIRLIENNGARPSKQQLRPNTLLLGLHTPREQLWMRVELRVDAMLAAGLEHEAAALADRYGWNAEPMKGIGYYQWKDYFAGTQTLAETRQKIIKGTMDLAKRQRTWFKRTAYRTVPDSDSSFLAEPTSGSDDRPSLQADVAHKSLTQNQPNSGQPATLNNSIHWLITEDKFTESVDITTTFLHTFYS